MSKKIIIIILLIIALIIIFSSKPEKFTAYGALQQLYGRDPQDSYQMSNMQKYMPPLYYGGWGWRSPFRYYPSNYPNNNLWNNPTRLDKYYAPPFGSYPYLSQ